MPTAIKNSIIDISSEKKTKELATNFSNYLKGGEVIFLYGEIGVGKTTFAKHLDEKVATLHLKKVGAKLTKLSKEQADYISVGTEGPFKPDAYRY